ncbi:hypothetical protein NW755_010677 [Fusarium falciforme]|uniref:CN hydrolase domain-containing protein n=1 Tax=Fusarium falciforme TaxID=195108 RepID=A0A9W8UY88_9HYPO|nr:hypothetical protein NW755_010677 [Fusarium falciforme]
MPKTIKVATIQAEPIWNDLQGSVNKSIALIREAAGNGANVIRLPKIKPTHIEHPIYGDDQDESLKTVILSKFGNVSGLSCQKHTKALLRHL